MSWVPQVSYPAPVSVKYQDAIHSCSALVDSGAEGNFLDIYVAAQWGIPVIPLPSPISVHSLNGLLLSSVTHSTPSVSLVVSGNHREVIQLYLLDAPGVPVVLGHPWLVQHNPHVDWSGNSVSSWSQSCLASCLGAALSPGSLSSVFQVETADLSGVPVEYHDLCRVFTMSLAMSLPSHRPYVCAIDLLPGTSPPKGRLYSLSGPEREAMDKYIKESLNAGPHPSLFLTCWRWVLLHKEGWLPAALHWLLGSKWHHHKKWVSSASDFICFWIVTGSQCIH